LLQPLPIEAVCSFVGHSAMSVGIETLAELLDAALGALEEGIAVLDAESRVVAWNAAATAIAGYLRADLLSRKLPANFYRMEAQHQAGGEQGDQVRVPVGPEAAAVASGRPVPVSLRHSQGHSLPAMLRRTPLRDALGKRFGTLLRFHSVEAIDSLPRGAIDGEGDQVQQLEQSQADMECRLDEAWLEWTANEVPFGVLWIAVDQAPMLRKTHGRDASEAMLTIVERTLLHGLRPMEILGRWGDNEFLVLSHERTAEMLMAHAQHLAGLARTADFRWWGDRVTLTVSIGAAQAEGTNLSALSPSGSSLSVLLKAAQGAMQASIYAGGNRVTGHHDSRHDDIGTGG
jgi:diguanylate cyclase (GGDEF)-like protein